MLKQISSACNCWLALHIQAWTPFHCSQVCVKPQLAVDRRLSQTLPQPHGRRDKTMLVSATAPSLCTGTKYHTHKTNKTFKPRQYAHAILVP